MKGMKIKLVNKNKTKNFNGIMPQRAFVGVYEGKVRTESSLLKENNFSVMGALTMAPQAPKSFGTVDVTDMDDPQTQLGSRSTWLCQS